MESSFSFDALELDKILIKFRLIHSDPKLLSILFPLFFQILPRSNIWIINRLNFIISQKIEWTRGTGYCRNTSKIQEPELILLLQSQQELVIRHRQSTNQIQRWLGKWTITMQITWWRCLPRFSLMVGTQSSVLQFRSQHWFSHFSSTTFQFTLTPNRCAAKSANRFYRLSGTMRITVTARFVICVEQKTRLRVST